LRGVDGDGGPRTGCLLLSFLGFADWARSPSKVKLGWFGGFLSKAINITHSDLDSSKKTTQSDLGPLPGIFLPEVKMPRNSSKIMATV
jgi:hypothetical protein